ncbi:hypothetical protein NU10_10560 [Flavobacterium dauae]|uniref:hypothetical protein n=1 Tax=Flavobacterium dauae TaxID=1563479 RepID=UPI00101B3097|nr:hypothetical protein [Flavobacterium dauae]WLD23145.1 hypothetical protein NU10_10560 [Flavobacterium dauae]
MKNALTYFLPCIFLLCSCTVDDVSYNEKTEESNSVLVIDQLFKTFENKTNKAHNKQSLQDLINQIEAEALQDETFFNLVDENYSTPLAADIEAILTDADAVLTNLSISTTVKNYVRSILNTDTQTALNTLSQTIQNDVLLTSVEKAMLLDIIDLQKQNVLGNGIGDDWDKKGIIAYLQGAAQTKANAVLNTVIIQVLAGN